MLSKSSLCFIFTSVTITFLLGCSKFEYMAGNDVKGFSDGSFVEAKFSYPTEMAVDERNGDLYVLDQNTFDNKGIGKQVIRRLTTEGKVSTIVKFEYEETLIKSIKIKDNYLYFSNETGIKRFNVSSEIKIENVVGTLERKDITGDFETARFSNIDSINFDNEDNIVILDDRKIKKANLKTKKVEEIKFDVEGSADYFNGWTIISSENPTFISIGIDLLTINTKTNELYFRAISTFFTEIFKINLKSQILATEIKDPRLDSFIFDNDGVMYFVSINSEKIFKSIENNTEELSGFGGVLKIEKSINFPEGLIGTSTSLAIDNKKGILYMSGTSENKIFKLNIKK